MALNINLKNNRVVIITVADDKKIIIGLNPNQKQGILIDAPKEYGIVWTECDFSGSGNNVKKSKLNRDINGIPKNEESL